MNVRLPPNAPKTSAEAFARVREMHKGVTIDDLPILALAEAIGLKLYENLAEGVEDPEVKKLLLQNGREEMAHAHRVSKAIEILTGEPFPIPSFENNPFYSPMPSAEVNKATLAKLAAAEFAGQDMYAGIAKSFDNAEAVALFLQNGKEEAGHGARLEKAAALLAN